MVPYLHDLILELGQESVDNLVLLDGQRVQVDLLHAVDLASLDQTAQLGDGLPLLLLALAATTSSATATATTTTTISASGCESTAATSASVSHGVVWLIVGVRRGGGGSVVVEVCRGEVVVKTGVGGRGLTRGLESCVRAS